jgi:hypothetical protein
VFVDSKNRKGVLSCCPNHSCRGRRTNSITLQVSLLCCACGCHFRCAFELPEVACTGGASSNSLSSFVWEGSWDLHLSGRNVGARLNLEPSTQDWRVGPLANQCPLFRRVCCMSDGMIAGNYKALRLRIACTRVMCSWKIRIGRVCFRAVRTTRVDGEGRIASHCKYPCCAVHVGCHFRCAFELLVVAWWWHICSEGVLSSCQTCAC